MLPPFTDLRSVQTLVDGDRLSIRYGAQDVSVHDSGAYTGEISATMLAKLGCSYVVVGHSERREHHGETDETVNAKARQAIGGRDDADRVRRRGSRRTPGRRARAYTLAQVDGSLAGFSAGGDRLAGDRLRAGLGDRHRRGGDAGGRAGGLCGDPRAGSRESAGDEAADGCRILYGGSVKAANIAGIMVQPDVDGALVGGASLQAEEFGGICRFYDMPAL